MAQHPFFAYYPLLSGRGQLTFYFRPHCVARQQHESDCFAQYSGVTCRQGLSSYNGVSGYEGRGWRSGKGEILSEKLGIDVKV